MLINNATIEISRNISTSKDPSLWIESFVIIDLRGVFTTLNWCCVCHANLHKELKTYLFLISNYSGLHGV